MICTSVCLSPRVDYSMVLVEPVELQAICRAQVELRRGTGGTGVGLGFCWRESPVPPVTPIGTTENHQKRLQVPPVPPVTPRSTMVLSPG